MKDKDETEKVTDIGQRKTERGRDEHRKRNWLEMKLCKAPIFKESRKVL